MNSWPSPAVPPLPGRGRPLALYDTARDGVHETTPEGPARMYVCGITPYDATHLGHAATMITFDLINRSWRDAGQAVSYVQNVTDIDDPLLDRATMLDLFPERGGDPDRAGKRDPLDPLLWRGGREGEPSWAGSDWAGGDLGPGRPGWHVECAVIALRLLGERIDVQGGGNDLVFPHHEMSAAHAEVLTGEWPFAGHYVHAGMIGLNGEKMSKSKGNLVFVSRLRADRVDPGAIRLALFAGHYRADRPWTAGLLTEAETRLARWREAVSLPTGPSAEDTV